MDYFFTRFAILQIAIRKHACWPETYRDRLQSVLRTMKRASSGSLAHFCLVDDRHALGASTI